jgi:hypothetical protein
MYPGGRYVYDRYYIHPSVVVDSHLAAAAAIRPQPERPPVVEPAWPNPTANDAYLQAEPPPFHGEEDPIMTMMMTNNHNKDSEEQDEPAALSTANTTTAATTAATAAAAATAATTTAAAANEGGGGGQRGGDATYVLRIHEMLEDAEKESQTHIVSWQPHGRAFKIHNEALFVDQIMPRYFKAKIGSFRRWLRAWGFVRMTEGKDRDAWYHRYFVRGVSSLCHNMTRQEMAQAMINWPPAGEVPDFYSAASGSTLSEQPQASPSNNNVVKNPKRLRGTILEDLRQMLQDAETEGHTHIVGWMPHGRAFKIHSKELFQGLMPRYFKTSKVTHLSDTLRIWGFRRLKKNGPDKGAYYHRSFVKDDPSLSRHQTRIQMKDSMAHWPPSLGEPDLYKAPEPAPALEPAPPPQQQQPLTGATPADPILFDPHTFRALVPGQPPPPLHPQPPGYCVPNTNLCIAGAAAMAAYAPAARIAAALVASPPSPLEEPNHHNKTTNDSTYVLRIHEMLEDSSKEGNQGIVSWQPHGRAFKIHDEKEFVAKIMPRYFKAKMGSFLRWLRAWGFVRMTEGKDRGGWYHRYFVRGVTSLCSKLTRQQMLKAMEDWLPAGQVPNFCSAGTGGVLSEATVTSPPTAHCKNPKRLRGTVPENLRQMLSEAEEEGNMSIVSWLSHGRAFKIHNKSMFAEQILSRYFKATKFTYFSDTLRIWGFQRIKKGCDKGGYYHKYFVKDQPQLSRHLSRVQMKESMTPWPPPQGEPDLYPRRWRPDLYALTEGTAPLPSPAELPEPNGETKPTLDETAQEHPETGEKRKRDQWETAVV